MTTVADSPPEQSSTLQSEAPDAREVAKVDAAALRELLAPVRSRVRLGQLLQLIGSAATVVPFIGIVELGRTLLAPGPVDSNHVWFVVWLVLAGLGARAFFSGLALAITHFADVDLQASLRRRIIAKLGRLPLGWFTRTSSGEVRKAAQNDVHELHYLVAHADVETAAALATPLFALIYCFYLDWRLGLLAIATLPLYVIAYAWMVRDMTERMAQMNAGMAKISATIVEFVSGVAVVKTFGQVGKAHKRFLDAADEFNDSFAGYMKPMLRIEAASSITLSAPLILLVNLAGGFWFVSAGWVEPIEVVGATLIAMILPTALITVSMAMHNRQQAGAAAKRLIDLFALDELAEPTNPITPQDNTVSFAGVGFSYPGRPGEPSVRALEGIDLTLRPGTMTALVGRSGSGKSTLAALVPRFHDPDVGVVRIGGIDIRDIGSTTLYKRVGFVLQDVSLLGISVRDNIVLGKPDATEDQVIAAAQAARIHDRIMALPNGYDTVVGEGAEFSGGEAQRVSIARALLADAPILVLDEATAFADPESEAAIQQAIATLIAGRTVLVIAHRLGSIVGADRIVVLDDGRIVESGTHPELVEKQGFYATMWSSYLAGTTRLDEEIAIRERRDHQEEQA